MNKNSVDIDEHCEEQFHIELTQFVDTLPQATPQQIENYNNKMLYINRLENEIRTTTPSFRPVYDPSLDREPTVGNKYLDVIYTLGTISKD